MSCMVRTDDMENQTEERMARTITVTLPEPERRALAEMTEERRDKNRSAVIRQIIDAHLTERFGPEWFRRFEAEADREEVA